MGTVVPCSAGIDVQRSTWKQSERGTAEANVMRYTLEYLSHIAILLECPSVEEILKKLECF